MRLLITHSVLAHFRSTGVGKCVSAIVLAAYPSICVASYDWLTRVDFAINRNFPNRFWQCEENNPRCSYLFGLALSFASLHAITV
jgi:hypothetical protein